MEHNIDSILKNAFSEIQQFMLTGKNFDDLKLVKKAAESLCMPCNSIAVLSVIYVKCEQFHSVEQKEIVTMLLHYFDGKASEIRGALRHLVADDHLNKYDDNSNVYYYLNNKTQRAIDENEYDHFLLKHPKGLEQILSYFHQKALDQDRLRESEIDNILYTVRESNLKVTLIHFIDDHFFFHSNAAAFVVMATCARAFIDNSAFDFGYMVRYIQFSRNDVNSLRKAILQGTWLPIKLGYIELTGGGHVEFNPNVQLTEKGFDYFMKEIDSFTLKLIRNKMGAVNTPLIKPKEIKNTQLYFSESFTNTTSRITELISIEKFNQYQNNLNQNDRMKGITMLFHGSPGCGKTEFALQIAKKTNRPLMKIQVSDFMSKWVGDSESNLKRIFNDYRKVFQKHSVAPILFLNECDQIIGKRVNTQNSVDQMTNALQNILLEEMETFGGILIGTTNLTQNMDPAFERRWTIKLAFEPPTQNAIVQIWKSTIKGLRIDEARILASTHELTPGEIMNVARRFEFEKLLGLQSKRINVLLELCETEKYSKQVSLKPVGFELNQSIKKVV